MIYFGTLNKAPSLLFVKGRQRYGKNASRQLATGNFFRVINAHAWILLVFRRK